MSKSQKIIVFRITVSSILFAVGMIVPMAPMYTIGIMLLAYVICGYSVLIDAAYGILNRQLLDENFLMAVATIGALALQEYSEALGVMLFYLIGTFLENHAVDKSRKSISAAMDIVPDFARVLIEGQDKIVDPYEVSIGDIIEVRPGEKIPLDGTVIEGDASIDTSPLTGESAPQDVSPGEEVISGCLNTSGLIKIKVTSEYEDSTVAKILELVENATIKKAKAERFITKFAHIYTPIVVVSAIVLAVAMPLITGDGFSTWIYRSLLFLVVSCPCALVISVPLSFFGGIGSLSSIGVLVKGGVYLESIAKSKTFMFDKTGTLTKGDFTVSSIHPAGCTLEELITVAAHVEYHSNHPLAKAIVEKFNAMTKKENPKNINPINLKTISKYEELPGKGSSAFINGKIVACGNEKLMNLLSISDVPTLEGSSVVHVACDQIYMGYISLDDKPRKYAKKTLDFLKSNGVKTLIMLTGDNKTAAINVADKLGISKVYAELLPQNKVEIAEEYSKNHQEDFVFMGDGINDAPLLAMADVGISMGGLGSDAAIEASDIVILDDDFSKLADTISIAKRTMLISKENIILALTIKIAVLALGAFGIANMWMAIFADVGVSLIAILNSMRLLLLTNKRYKVKR